MMARVGGLFHPSSKSWMTDEIIGLMEQHRLSKCDGQSYRHMQRAISRKIREAKTQYFEEQCREIEGLEVRHDTFNMFRKVKDAAGMFTRNRARLLYDERGNPVLVLADRLVMWENYIAGLFKDSRAEAPLVISNIEGPPITSEEVERAIKSSKNRRAVGPDEIPCEIYKLIQDKGVISEMTSVFNNMYDSGHIPGEWLEFVFVTLPKKANARI